MPSCSNVYIEYGPYNLNGIAEYRLERLEGLQIFLKKRGHKIAELREKKNWNNVSVIVNEQTVFECKLDELEFEGDGELDKLVIQAEKCVTDAF